MDTRKHNTSDYSCQWRRDIKIHLQWHKSISLEKAKRNVVQGVQGLLALTAVTFTCKGHVFHR